MVGTAEMVTGFGCREAHEGFSCRNPRVTGDAAHFRRQTKPEPPLNETAFCCLKLPDEGQPPGLIWAATSLNDDS